MSNRTTHSDLAQLLVDHVDRLRRVPAGYLVSNEATLKTLADAARILIEQDRRVEDFTVASRESTDPKMWKNHTWGVGHATNATSDANDRAHLCWTCVAVP